MATGDFDPRAAGMIWHDAIGWYHPARAVDNTFGPVFGSQDMIVASAEIIDAASDLVALWKQQKIDGLPRAERNAAIEEVRNRLIAAVEKFETE